jgi:hypothetical protein
MTDDLDIPKFLRISAADRRAAWLTWTGFPQSTSAPARTPVSVVQAEIAERKRAKTKARIGRMLAVKAEREQFGAIPRSKRRWDVNTCRFVAEST